MAAGNVETGFCLPSEVNKDFIRNLIWQHQQQQQQKNNQQQQKNNQQQQKNNQQQNINRFTSKGRSKYKQEKICTEASF